MGHISLETTRSEVVLRLKGIGTAKINWNDGTPVKEVELSRDGEEFKSEPNDSRRTISIDGDNITYLRCTDNLITKLEVNENPKLKVLRCRDNKLQTLDIRNLKSLTVLSCSVNKLNSLDVNNNTKLEELRCGDNELKELDIMNLPFLETLSCSGNYGMKLIGKVGANFNSIVDISNYKGDVVIDKYDFPKLFELKCINNTGITSITVRNCHKLVKFHCENNENLKSISLENLPELGYITVCSNKMLNKLEIDHEDCPKVGEINCSRNSLKNLNLYDCAKLQDLNCSGNGLTNLLVDGCIKLRSLNCSFNNLTMLDIEPNEEGQSNLANLTTLHCGFNLLTDKALNNVFEGLPKVAANKIAELTINGNPGHEMCNKEIAQKKNWKINPPLALVTGNCQIIKDPHSVVENVLGQGYDISGKYAVSQGKGSVLDFGKLNDNKRINFDPSPDAEGIMISSEGKKSYSKKAEEKLGISVAAGCFGVTFKSETETGFSEETTNDESFKYMMINSIQQSGGKYSITGIESPQKYILGALSGEFLLALEIKTGKEIIDIFGTHVIGGMLLGSTMRYYMKFKKSVSTKATTKTFSQSCSLGYGSGGNDSTKAKKENEDATKKNSEATKDKSIGEKIADAIKNGISVTMVKEAFAIMENVSTKPDKDLTKEEKETKEKAKSTLEKLGISFSLAVSYTETETINTREELENMEMRCHLVGGDSTRVLDVLRDPVDGVKDWQASCQNSKNWAWIDFMPNKTFPIYNFVPEGHPKEIEIKDAWDEYLRDKQVIFNEYIPEPDIITQPFYTRRLQNKTVFLNHGDWEMMQKKGRNPSYSLSFELVNIDGGGAGVDVKLTVEERHGDYTTIEVHELIELKSAKYDKIAIHPDYDKIRYNSITQKPLTSTSAMNEWYNANVDALLNGYIYDETYKIEKIFKGCLDPNSYLQIQYDGKGDDWDNVAVEGTFKVKILGFKKKR